MPGSADAAGSVDAAGAGPAPEAPSVAAVVTPSVPVAGGFAVVPPVAVRKPRRRGRTTALIGAALVLGLVAGTCTGYLVQADREPTKLPPLSQPVLAQAKGEGPEPLSAARDRSVKTDGDLRELLIEKPRSAEKNDWLPDDGWMDLAEFAGTYKEPGYMFGHLTTEKFRRAVATGWLDDDHGVEVRLIQFHQEETLAAAALAEDGQYWADDAGDTDSWLVPGTEDGRVYVHRRPETEPGYEPVYSAEAHAWRGDITVLVLVFGSEPIEKKMIMKLVERQMERL